MNSVNDLSLEIDCLEEKLLYILLYRIEKQRYIFSNCSKNFFKDATNSRIYEIADNLFKNGITVDSTVICEKSKGDNFQKILDKLIDISNCFAPSTQAQLYCKLLFEKHLKKCVKYIKNVDDVEKINQLKQKYTFEETSTNTHISANIDKLISGYEKEQSNVITTLYGKLDNYLGSFMGGDYIVLGAATSMGKSTFALNLARQICMQEKTVLYFSLEMPLAQIQNKLICMQEKIAANKYRSAGLNPIEFERYKKGAKDLKEWSLNVICDYNLDSEKLRSYIQKQKEKQLDFVIIDYLGLMSGYSNKTLYEKTTLLSRNIKIIATEFNVPILCLVQLNRDSKGRQDKRPLLSDIRESGAIEQDADIILLLHREGYYNPEVSPRKLEVWVSKNRHGESNKFVELDFDLKTQTISEMF